MGGTATSELLGACPRNGIRENSFISEYRIFVYIDYFHDYFRNKCSFDYISA